MTGTAVPTDGQRVAVVTGGGGGIGAAIAEELGRQGAFVVTMDPLVSLDGRAALPATEDTTAGRILAAGGSARASAVSVTDREAVRDLFEELGRLDAVVNVAGISRPTSFAKGREEDWRAVLEVHLDGYLNVLAAALPMMGEAGKGHILGVTSGSGWRPADAGAYSCAKRAVAALTWQLGHHAPPGVTLNAISPIAVTRMVTAALGGRRSSATGGLSLASMPEPEALGPFGAYLVSDETTWCRGQVLFTGGSEVAVIEPPRLLELVRTDDVTSLAHALEVVIPGALAPAEAQQRTAGGNNARFGPVFGEADTVDPPAGRARSCAVITADPVIAGAVTAALEARGATCTTIPVAADFRGAATALASTVASVGPLDAVVVALGGMTSAIGPGRDWAQVLAEHDGIVGHLHADAAWARAVADHAAATDRPIRLISLIDATTAGGRTRAHASAQLARAGLGATEQRVAAFAVSIEAPPATEGRAVAELVAHLVSHPEASALSGAELAVGAGWIGLRSHPHPRASISFGGPALPARFDGALRSVVAAPEASR